MGSSHTKQVIEQLKFHSFGSNRDYTIVDANSHLVGTIILQNTHLKIKDLRDNEFARVYNYCAAMWPTTIWHEKIPKDEQVSLLERPESSTGVRATLPYCSQHEVAFSLTRLAPLVTSGRLILDS